MNDLLQLDLTTPAHLSIESLLINLILGTALAFVVRWLYLRYSHTLSNKESLANIFPLLTLITILIISVVKSSLALSLGLVGALSIVRFRSAIKEPEELIYLFLALAVGLSLGADQRWPTIVAVLFIAVMLTVRDRFITKRSSHNFMITFEGEDKDFILKGESKFLDLINQHTKVADLRRIDVEGDVLQSRVLIKAKDSKSLLNLVVLLKKEFPASLISFVDMDNLL
jgi:hypothetical protein